MYTANAIEPVNSIFHSQTSALSFPQYIHLSDILCLASLYVTQGKYHLAKGLTGFLDKSIDFPIKKHLSK